MHVTMTNSGYLEWHCRHAGDEEEKKIGGKGGQKEKEEIGRKINNKEGKECEANNNGS